MRYFGECHCGKVKVVFETDREPSALGVRTCQCGFCKRHGAHSVSDPQGEILVAADPGDLVRYRFGLRTADFLVCKHCGVYCATVTGDGEEKRASINTAGLAIAAFGLIPIGAGTFNLCPVAPAWGGHFVGARYCPRPVSTEEDSR